MAADGPLTTSVFQVLKFRSFPRTAASGANGLERFRRLGISRDVTPGRITGTHRGALAQIVASTNLQLKDRARGIFQCQVVVDQRINQVARRTWFASTVRLKSVPSVGHTVRGNEPTSAVVSRP